METKSRKLVAPSCETDGQGWSALPRGMRAALVRQGARPTLRQQWGVSRAAAKVCKRANLMRRLVTLGDRRLVTLSWASDVPAFPDAFWSEMVPWIFDCWGPEWPQWEALLRRHRIKLALFSARASAQEFARRIPGLETRWLPEAMELKLLHPGKPLAERSVHVFEMGRKMMSTHDRIREPLKAAGKKHLFDEPGKHATAIPTLDELYRTMGDSAMVVCYPKAMSHPAGAGPVETLTQRYLETMGSGALAVGYCPQELKDLYGFNPVVDLSPDDPAAHMLEVLNSLPNYQDLADRALARTRELGGFDVRAAEMLRLIDEYDLIRSRANGKN